MGAGTIPGFRCQSLGDGHGTVLPELAAHTDEASGTLKAFWLPNSQTDHHARYFWLSRISMA